MRQLIPSSRYVYNKYRESDKRARIQGSTNDRKFQKTEEAARAAINPPKQRRYTYRHRQRIWRLATRRHEAERRRSGRSTFLVSDCPGGVSHGMHLDRPSARHSRLSIKKLHRSPSPLQRIRSDTEAGNHVRIHRCDERIVASASRCRRSTDGWARSCSRCRCRALLLLKVCVGVRHTLLPHVRVRVCVCVV